MVSYLMQGGLHIVEGPDRIEVYLVDAPNSETDPYSESLNLVRRKGPVKTPPQITKRLIKYFRDPDRYYWGIGTGCMFHPDAEVVFRSMDSKDVIQTVNFLVCFGCGEVMVFRKEDITDGTYRKTYGSRRMFSDPTHSLLTTMKDLFPDDGYIQKK